MGAGRMIFDQLHDTRTAKALEGLGRNVLLAMLSEMEPMAEKLAHIDGQFQEVPLTASNPDDRAFLAGHVPNYT